MARSIFAPLEGNTVALCELTGPFAPCRKCGCKTATVTVEPVGIHLGGLRCTSCNSITSWLGRDHLAAMLASTMGRAA
ncbi:MAG: hypothetical protein RSE12_17100 [Fuscovulum sp.]|nr:MAG: hypothetical protein RSE12_17100 [Fuscovulum sp.]